MVRIRCLARAGRKESKDLRCTAQVETLGRTIYEMCKAPADRGTVMDGIRLLEKQGGKSGHWVAAS